MNRQGFDREGYAVIEGVIAADQIAVLIYDIQNLAPQEQGYPRGGVRDLLNRVPYVRELAGSPEIRRLVEPVIGKTAFPVRAILFDKDAASNWKVPWHQDLTIAVRERREADGYGPWSTKGGTPHVQPPVAVLERLLAVRVHLDDCRLENGPLRVLPGSHRFGRLDADLIQQLRAQIPEVTCAVLAGYVILMRPLLLHASSPAESPGHRRVIHIEYAAGPLPGGLEWCEESVV